MRIAICHRPHSYSEQWINYCQQHNIQYKIVDAYSNNILEHIADCDVFMWHFNHLSYKDYLFAKQLIYVIEKHLGKITYPNYDTCWHFDDKVGQKYLFDAIGAHLVPTYIFYTRHEALDWIRHTTFPKVFKLRSGAGSVNVRLAKTAKQARFLINHAFKKGFENNNYFRWIKDRWLQYKNGGCDLKWLIIGLYTFHPYKERFHKEEIGYVYFQDFIANNDFDIRVLVIGNHAVAAKRANRINDFRASGSHFAIFDKNQINPKCIETAFCLSKKLKMQSIAFDFLFDNYKNPILTEISFCCGNKDYSATHGFWTDDMQWHECQNINICDWIIEDVIENISAI